MAMKPEITSLNINDLDVQELERRLELASVAGFESAEAWICGVNIEDPCPSLDCIGYSVDPM